MCQFKSKGRKRLVSRLEGHLAGGVPSCSGEDQISVLSGPSAAQSGHSHIREGATCSTQSTDGNANFIQKQPHRNTQGNV